MNNTTFDLLPVAVDLAREQKISRRDGLRGLLGQFPHQLTQVDEALSLWSYARRYPPEGGTDHQG